MSTEPTPKTPTPRTRTRGKALLPAPVVPSIAEAHELASNPKAMDLSMALVNVQGERDYWKRLAGERADKIGEVAAQAKENSLELKGQRDALQQLLTNAEDSAKAWEQTASERQGRIEALEIQVASWKERRNESDLRAEALQVERDQWKATAERYQDSTNHLGGLVKAQERGEYHGPEADLPGGLMEGVNWGAVVAWIGAVLAIVAFWAGLVIGGAK